MQHPHLVIGQLQQHNLTTFRRNTTNIQRANVTASRIRFFQESALFSQLERRCALWLQRHQCGRHWTNVAAIPFAYGVCSPTKLTFGDRHLLCVTQAKRNILHLSVMCNTKTCQKQKYNKQASSSLWQLCHMTVLIPLRSCNYLIITTAKWSQIRRVTSLSWQTRNCIP